MIESHHVILETLGILGTLLPKLVTQEGMLSFSLIQTWHHSSQLLGFLSCDLDVTPYIFR